MQRKDVRKFEPRINHSFELEIHLKLKQLQQLLGLTSIFECGYIFFGKKTNLPTEKHLEIPHSSFVKYLKLKCIQKQCKTVFFSVFTL